jgi:protein-L-isoaspartate(D-aspartate) O-methyltransferase
MARIAEAVVALEEDAAMAAEAESRLAAQDVFNVAVVQGALAEGCASQAPYDAILIEGAVEQVPEALADQLREGGRIVAMFREGNLGTVRIGHKLDGRLNWRFGFHATAPLLPGFARPRGFVL